MSTTTNLLPGTVLRFERLSSRRNRQTGIRPTVVSMVLIDTIHRSEDGSIVLASGPNVLKVVDGSAHCTSRRHLLTARQLDGATVVREPVK